MEATMSTAILVLVGLYLLYKALNNSTVVAGFEYADKSANKKISKMDLESDYSDAKFRVKMDSKIAKLEESMGERKLQTHNTLKGRLAGI